MVKLFLRWITQRASRRHVRHQKCSSRNSSTRHYEMQVRRSSLRISRLAPIKYLDFYWTVEFADSRIGKGTDMKDKSLHPNTVNEHGSDWGNIQTTHLCPSTWTVCITLMKHIHDRGYKTGHICSDAPRRLCVAFKTTSYWNLHITTIAKITNAVSVSIQFLPYKEKE
jgi:hypothetical protein